MCVSEFSESKPTKSLILNPITTHCCSSVCNKFKLKSCALSWGTIFNTSLNAMIYQQERFSFLFLDKRSAKNIPKLVAMIGSLTLTYRMYCAVKPWRAMRSSADIIFLLRFAIVYMCSQSCRARQFVQREEHRQKHTKVVVDSSFTCRAFPSLGAHLNLLFPGDERVVVFCHACKR